MLSVRISFPISSLSLRIDHNICLLCHDFLEIQLQMYAVSVGDSFLHPTYWLLQHKFAREL